MSKTRVDAWVDGYTSNLAAGLTIFALGPFLDALPAPQPPAAKTPASEERIEPQKRSLPEQKGGKAPARIPMSWLC